MKSNRTHENTVRSFQNCLVGWIGVFALQILASGPYVWHPWSRTTNHYCHFWSHVASLTKKHGRLRLVLYIPTLKKTCKQHCSPTQQLKLSFSIWSIYENMKPFEVIQSSPHLGWTPCEDVQMSFNVIKKVWPTNYVPCTFQLFMGLPRFCFHRRMGAEFSKVGSCWICAGCQLNPRFIFFITECARVCESGKVVLFTTCTPLFV